MLSIVDATCEAAKRLRLTKLGLFGARFTMQAKFYPEVFSKYGMAVTLPRADEGFLHSDPALSRALLRLTS